MPPAIAKKQGGKALLLLALPVACQVMGESTRDRCKLAHAESSNWWLQRIWQKDKDSSHFEQYLRKQEYKVNTKDSSLMLWPSLEEGLEKRNIDEMLLQTHILKLQQEGGTLDEKAKLAMSNTLSEVLYGKGITVQDRQAYLERHGCVKATTEALELINKTVSFKSSADTASSDKHEDTTAKRGIVEIGIGFGQWARLLVDTYNIDIVAFDNMLNLPLDPRVHTVNSTGYEQYFYQGKVRFGDSTIFSKEQVKKMYKLDGRVLMIIFPDPGPMAVECLQAYSNSNEHNDTFIYVGEGRGGANGNSAFFDELERVDEQGVPKWQLVETCKLSPFGDKGFERFFVFKKNVVNANK